jgi:hypothetical protein
VVSNLFPFVLIHFFIASLDDQLVEGAGSPYSTLIAILS